MGLRYSKEEKVVKDETNRIDIIGKEKNKNENESEKKENNYRLIEDDSETIIKINKRIGTKIVRIILYLEKTDENIILYDDFKSSFPNEILYTCHIKTDVTRLVENIQSDANDPQIFLITTENFCKQLLEETYFTTENKINQIFIISRNSSLQQELTSKFKMVKIMTIELNHLKEKLLNIIQDFNLEDYNKVQWKFNYHFNSDNNVLSYLYHKYILSMFISQQLDDSNEHSKLMLNQAKVDFIVYCQNNYLRFKSHANSEEKENYNLSTLILDIENNKFIEDTVVKWYTKETFFYPMINEALRNDDICNIFKIRYAFYHLTEALEKFKVIKQPEFLYRASLIHKDELKLLTDFKNKLHYIQFRGFTSTTTNRKATYLFGNRNKNRINNNSIKDNFSILYQIKTDNHQNFSIYDIKKVSAVKSEDEILINGDLFLKICKIEENTNKDEQFFDYLINLQISNYQDVINSISDENIQKTNQLISNLIESIQTKEHNHSYFYLCEILIITRQDEQLKELLDEKNSLLSTSLKGSDLATHYYYYGSLYWNKGEYEKALDNHFKSLKINEKTLPENHLNIGLSYNNIGNVYWNKGEYENALDNYFKSLKIYEKTLPENHPEIATSYNNIGNVYLNKGEYDKALDNMLKSLKIYEKTRLENHPEIATSYNNIGNLYLNKGEYDKALDNMLKSLKIYEKILPENHPNIATSYNNIGIVYENKGEYDKALNNFLKSLKIYEKTLPENHPVIATSYNNIGNVYLNKGEYDKALDNMLKSLKIYEKTLPENHPNIASSYNNIGSVYLKKGEYDKALNNHFKSLKIVEKTLPENHPDIAGSYNNIGSVYLNKGEYDKALDNMLKSLKIYEKTLPENHPNIALLYNNIGNVYWYNGEYQKALHNFLKSLKSYEKTLPENNETLIKIRKKIENLRKKY